MTASGRALALVLVAAAASVVVVGGGCPHQLHATRPYAEPTAAELLAVLAARQQAVSSMNARVRATSWLGGERVRATVLMLVDRPGRLRFEAEVSLQGTVAVLATDGTRFALLDTMKNELHVGPACAANVASLIRIPMAPADIAAILLGDVRLPALLGDVRLPAPTPARPESAPSATAAADATHVEWDPKEDADVLALPRADGWLRLTFKRQAAGDVRLVGARAVGRDGRGRWRVAFEDLEATPAGAGASVPMPRTVRFAEGEESFDDGVEVKIKDVTLNQPLAPESFTIPASAAAGATPVEVGCGTK